MKRKCLAWILALVMTLTLLPGAALAAAPLQEMDNGETVQWSARSGQIPLIDDASVRGDSWNVLRLTNQHRMSLGLDPLSTFDSLQKVANQRAYEIQFVFSHSRPDGSDFDTALRDYNVSNTGSWYSWGENIAAGYLNAAEVVDGWLNSPGHRSNIENDGFVHMGAGFYTGSPSAVYSYGWSQNFLGSSSCRVSSLQLSQTVIAGGQGADLEELLTQADIVVTATCSQHGTCKLPLIAAMCSGYRENEAEEQIITVRYGGQTAQLTIVPQQPAEPDLPFTDVSEKNWFFDEVQYVYENELMSGTGGGAFEPNSNLTRVMAWTILARIDGETVSGSAWEEDARNWAMASGVSDGTNPRSSISRQELAAMLWRYVNQPGNRASLDGFSDVDEVAGWAAEAMSWAVDAGLIQGSNNKLNPRGNATRAEAAAILMRFCENVVK